MTNKNIALIGFMGAGKSSVGQKLARLLHKELFSTDKLIEEKEGQTVAGIFEKCGEAHFRKLEREVVRDVSRKKNVIIDCGGGIVLDPENLSDLKKTGILIHLSVSPEVIYTRVKVQKHRPLLKVPDPKSKIKELLTVRLPLYEQADHTVDVNDKTIEEICQEIIAIVSHR